MHYRRLRRGQDLALPKRGDHFTPVGYQMAHLRVRALWGSAKQYGCVSCGSTAAEWAYDGCDPAQLVGHTNTPGLSCPYSIHPEFYKPLCVQCHRNEDIDRRDGRRKACRVDGCEKPNHGLGLCNTHWAAHVRRSVCYY